MTTVILTGRYRFRRKSEVKSRDYHVMDFRLCQRNRERWFWPLVVTESETICRSSLWPWAEVIFRIWVWSSGPVCSWVWLCWALKNEPREGGNMKSRAIHVSIWKNGVLGSGLVLYCLLAHHPHHHQQN
ncbi:hypothetical protein OIU78_006511 [Salix suchowensis]|nr:hypothetical protein OIU78_006511 [Salix suchowensis]